jgi:hypothetical protein
VSTCSLPRLVTSSLRRSSVSGNPAFQLPTTFLAAIAAGQVRVSNELRKQGMFVSPTGVRSVWLRHDASAFPMRKSSSSRTSEHRSLTATYWGIVRRFPPVEIDDAVQFGAL